MSGSGGIAQRGPLEKSTFHSPFPSSWLIPLLILSVLSYLLSGAAVNGRAARNLSGHGFQTQWGWARMRERICGSRH